MKKTFTILIAAIAAIMLITQPINVMGQSDNYYSNVTLPTSGTNVSGTKVKLSASGTEYDASKFGKSGNGGSGTISFPAHTTVIYVHCAAWNGKSSTLTLSTSATGISISQSGAWSLVSDSGLANNPSVFQLSTPTNAPLTTGYYKRYTMTDNNSATTVTFNVGSERAVLWGVNAAHTVTFNGNGGTYGDEDEYTQDIVRDVATDLAANQFTKTGYTFTRWTTASNGSGETYTDEQSVTLTDNLVLYAQWEEVSGPIKLSTPTNFSATAGHAQAEFTWDAVSNANGYTISYTPAGGSESTTTVEGGSTTSKTITGLTNGTVYTCKIKANGDGGTNYTDSDYSSTINVTPLYTITVQSNNDNYGSVELNGTSISASPAANYRVKAGAAGCTVVSGTATVTNNGDNTFSVSDYTNCTIQINFEAIPTHTATFSVNGATTSQNYQEGATITFPSDPADINGKKFVGWYGSTYSNPTTAPIFIDTEHETMGNSDITYYAVFADETGTTDPSWDVTAIGSLTSSDIFVIVGDNGSTYALPSADASSSPSATTITITSDGNHIDETQATVANNLKWNISGNSTNGYTFYPNGSTTKYLYILDDNKGVRVGTPASNTTEDHTLTLTDGYLTASFTSGNTTTSRYIGIYNSQDWRCYTSTTGNIANQTFAYYKYTAGSTTYANYNTTVVLPTVETPSFTVSEGTYNTEQSVQINCATTGATIYYTTNGNDPDANSTAYESGTNISITQTTTLKAIAIKGEDSSEIASATYTLKCATPQFDAPAGSYTEDQTVVISSTTGSTIYYTTDNTDPTNESTEYTAALTIDATTTLKAIAYKSGWTPSDVATAQYNLPIVYANIAAFKAAFSATSTTLVKITGPLTTVYHNGKNLYVQDATGGMLVYDAKAGTDDAVISRTYENGQTVLNIYGTYTKYNGLVEFIPFTDFPAPGPGTAVEPVDITYLTAENYATYESRLVRLTNATFAAGATYTSGSTGSNLNMTDGSSNTVVLRNGFNQLAGKITSGDKANVIGFATIYSKNGTTYQIFPRDNNDVQMILGTIEIDDEMTIDFAAVVNDGEIVEIEDGGVLTVAGTLTNDGDILVDEGGQLICSNSVEVTMEKNVTAYTDANKKDWYTLSTPVHTGNNAYVTFANIENIANATHNVYYLSEETSEWINNLGTPGFSQLNNGLGYIYRRAEGATLEFTGNTNVDVVEASLTYTATIGGSANPIAGFNLLGNPFTHNITWSNLTVSTGVYEDGYYLLDTEGGWSATASKTEPIAPMTAFLVQALAPGATIAFTNIVPAPVPNEGKGMNYANDNIMFTVENAEYSDNAYVLFKEGTGLNKVAHRNAEIPMLYVINNGENFGIANMSDMTKVINLGFEAKTMGQYTISLKAEGQYSYMHLIDKLTGNDVDMLVEDSYTFIGSQSDRKDRFVLNLNYNAAGIDTESDIFAYQNGNEIIVNGEGELQVFDVMGRMVSTQYIDGVGTWRTASVQTGVYIFRMNEKTQKIVVR